MANLAVSNAKVNHSAVRQPSVSFSVSKFSFSSENSHASHEDLKIEIAIILEQQQ